MHSSSHVNQHVLNKAETQVWACSNGSASVLIYASRLFHFDVGSFENAQTLNNIIFSQIYPPAPVWEKPLFTHIRQQP